jgi:hypothetical protein
MPPPPYSSCGTHKPSKGPPAGRAWIGAETIKNFLGVIALCGEIERDRSWRQRSPHGARIFSGLEAKGADKDRPMFAAFPSCER